MRYIAFRIDNRNIKNGEVIDGYFVRGQSAVTYDWTLLKECGTFKDAKDFITFIREDIQMQPVYGPDGYIIKDMNQKTMTYINKILQFPNTPGNRRPDFSPIDWSTFTQWVILNDFDAYEQFIFKEDELNTFDRWEKFLFEASYCDKIGVYMPFSEPNCAIQFSLNHYIYWMCIQYLNDKAKIAVFKDYNTGNVVPSPSNYCWACSYAYYILREENKGKSNDCFFCPLWPCATFNFSYLCETRDALYEKWKHGKVRGSEIAKMQWRYYDYMLK